MSFAMFMANIDDVLLNFVLVGLAAGPAEAGRAEGGVILLPPALVSPKLCFGCGLQALLQFAPADATAGEYSRQSGNFGSVASNHAGSSASGSSSSITLSGSSNSSSSNGSSGGSGGNGSGDMPADESAGSSPSAGNLLAPLLQGGTGSGWGGDAAAALVDVYRDSGYVLTWQGGAGRAMLREGAPPTTGLQVGAHQQIQRINSAAWIPS
jgi:hypothetical protein